MVCTVTAWLQLTTSKYLKLSRVEEKFSDK